MAATFAARQLTEAHRLAQARLGAATVSQLRELWVLLDPVDLDGTVPAWLRSTVPVVQAQNRASASLAANYVSRFRELELGSVDRFTPSLAPVAPVQQVATSLTVTGPAAIKSATRSGVIINRAADLALVKTAGAGMRLALAGGRNTIDRAIREDRRALGYARATSARPCAFCAMLASRGPVYSKETVSFQAHDHCSCTHEPVYRRDAEWPAGSRDLRALWDEATQGEGGNDALNAFRRALAAQ